MAGAAAKTHRANEKTGQNRFKAISTINSTTIAGRAETTIAIEHRVPAENTPIAGARRAAA